MSQLFDFLQKWYMVLALLIHITCFKISAHPASKITRQGNMISET